MGFTRYWRVRTDTDPAKLAEAGREMAKVIEASTVPLANFEGDPGAKPEINLDEGTLSFNGVGQATDWGDFGGDEGDACEPFNWPPDLNKPSSRDPQWTFDWCKTERFPYDEAVAACLLAAKAVLGEQIKISGDGDDPYGPDWGQG
jgi:hypothetical protein